MALVMTGAERLASSALHAAALVIALQLGYLLYQLQGIEGLAGGRFTILAVAGIVTDVVDFRA